VSSSPETAKLDHLRERYEYRRWAEPGVGGETLFIRDFFLAGRELPGLTPVRIEPLGGGPRSIQSMWRAGEDEEALLNVVVTETASRAEARAGLLAALGLFQARLSPQAEPGDVAFASPNEGAIVFALGNVVAVVRTAGTGIGGVRKYADALAELLGARPEGETPSGPQIEELSVGAEVAAGMSELILRVADPRKRPTWVKIFASGGEVVERDGALAFQATGDPPRRLEVYAVADDGATTSRALSLDEA
jgi:hypothetical protein